MRRTMGILRSPTQLIDLGSRHFSRIDESVHADIRELPYSVGHAFAQGLALKRKVTAIALIVHQTILLLTLSNGGRHCWKQKQSEYGNRNISGIVFGSHSINSVCLLGF